MCVARKLEPHISEECLVNKMAYHFDEGIVQARLCGQIKTITAMEALLGDYEQQDYYRRSRRQYERTTFNREEQNREQHQRTNHANRNDHNQCKDTKFYIIN